MTFEARLIPIYGRLFKRILVSQSTHNLRAQIHRTCLVCQKPENNEPIKYSATRASNWKSIESFTTQRKDVPPYQGISIVLSISVFLIYFCVLREENDLDEYMGSSLYERIPGLEEKQLLARIDYDRRNGNDTVKLEERLKEIRTKAALESSV